MNVQKWSTKPYLGERLCILSAENRNIGKIFGKTFFKEVSLLFFKIRLRMRILICVPQVLMQPLMNLSYCVVLSWGFHLLKLAGNCLMELCLKEEALFCMSQSRLRMTLDATCALQRVWRRMTLQLTSPFVKEVSRNVRFR